MGVIGLRALAALVRLFNYCAESGFYGVDRAFCFWKALLPVDEVGTLRPTDIEGHGRVWRVKEVN